MRRGILVGLAALLLAGAPALAEERTRSYGGSGADRLTRLIEYGDGLIAVGRTDSRNGDLAMRTRRNQAGWMLCLNGEGAPLWSYCTAKDGRNEMSAPFAHENGQISAVLTGRGIDGLEWLIVSGEGRLAQRRVNFYLTQPVCCRSPARALRATRWLTYLMHYRTTFATT